MFQDDSSRDGGKWLDSTCNLQVEPARFAYGLDIDMKEKRMIPSFVFIENWKDSCY